MSTPSASARGSSYAFRIGFGPASGGGLPRMRRELVEGRIACSKRGHDSFPIDDCSSSTNAGLYVSTHTVRMRLRLVYSAPGQEASLLTVHCWLFTSGGNESFGLA